jgi:hypothetical protein
MYGHAPASCSSSRGRLAAHAGPPGLAAISASALPPGWLDAAALAEIDRRLAAVAAPDARALLADAWVLLFALDALAGDADLCAAEIELRLAQLVGCASGRDVPEVAFDPVAILARSLSARLQGAAPAALFEVWAARLGKVASALLWEKVMLAGMPGRPTAQERADTLAPALDAVAWALLADALPMAA